MTIGEKIKSIRLSKNLTQKELGKLCGMADSAIRRYELGGANPKLETLKRIASALNVGLEEFMTDSELSLFENMAKLYLQSDFGVEELESLEEHTPQENYLMIKFRELNDNGQKKATGYIDDLSKIPEYQKAPTSAPENKIIVLPYFRAGVSAGSGIFILGNEAEDEIELPDLPEYEAADFAIDVNGDSMEPDFSHEDIALVQQDAELFPGDIGVFVVNSNAFIKELGENELISRNKDYKNIPIHEGDNVVCMGKVIGKVKTDEE